jgi:membrane-associated phospholipid phosphatase
MLLFFASYYLLNFDKLHIHSKINSFVGNRAIDTFFKYVTHIGDGLVAAIIALIVLILNAKKGIFIIITYVVSGLTTNVLKTHVFDVHRPHFVFGFYGHYFPQYKIQYVEGVKMLGLNSFPSGHATTSFAVFISLALITENKFIKFIFFVFAFLGAFSRTYLSQHWLVDITVGSLIGTGAAIIFYVTFFSSNFLQKYNKPLLNIFNP